jgi:transposase
MFEDSRKDSLTDSRETEKGRRDFQRIEVITGVARRRQWSDEEKARIVSETLVPGVGVSAVARRYGLGPSLIYGWRRQFRGGTDGSPPTPGAASFVPVVVTGDPVPAAAVGAIEVVVGAVTVRVMGAVDGARLRQVLEAVRGLE